MLLQRKYINLTVLCSAFLLLFSLILLYSINIISFQSPAILLLLSLIILSGALFYSFSKKYEYRIDFLIISILFLLGFIKACFGLNTTDPGFSLTKSYSFLNGHTNLESSYMWASNWLISFWLWIPQRPSLLWANTGFALQTTLNIFITLKTLKLFIKTNEKTEILFAVTSWILCTQGNLISNYTNLPAFIITVAIYLYLWGVKNNNSISVYVSGIIMGFSVHTRIPYIIYFGFPICILIFKLIVEKLTHKKENYYLLHLSAGIFSGLCLGFIILIILGNFSSYITNIRETFSNLFSAAAETQRETELHSSSSLFKKLIVQTIKSSLSCFILLLFYLPTRINNKKLKYIFSITLVFISTILFVQKQININYIILGFILFFFVAYSINNFKSENYPSILLLILISIFTGVGSSLGSDTGFSAIYSSGGIAFPLILGLFLVYNEKKSTNRIDRAFYPSIILIIFAFILLFNWKPIRGGISNYKSITYSTKINSIKGIYSSPERIKEVESLFNYCLEQEDFNSSKLVVLNSAPLLYYLFDKPYEIQNEWGPWIFLNTKDLTLKLITDYYENVIIDKQTSYLILATSAQRDNWPFIKVPTVMKGYAEKYEIVNNWIKSSEYKKVFSNDSFEVYKYSIQE